MVAFPRPKKVTYFDTKKQKSEAEAGKTFTAVLSVCKDLVFHSYSSNLLLNSLRRLAAPIAESKMKTQGQDWRGE